MQFASDKGLLHTKAELSQAVRNEAVRILQCIHAEADSNTVNFVALYLIYP